MRWMLLLTMLLPGTLYAQTQVQPLPEIVVDNSVHDFGVAGQDEKIEHDFRITNQGDANLLITDVRSSCDCVKQLMGDPHIPPESSLLLKVVFETRQSQGMQRRKVEFHTNDPRSPDIALELIGNVQKDFALIPNSLHFRALTKGAIATKTIRLQQFSDIPLKLHGLDASASWLSGNWKRVEGKDSRGFVIQVRVDERAPAGRHMEVISLAIEQEDKRVIDVPVLVYVADEVISPQQRCPGNARKDAIPGMELLR